MAQHDAALARSSVMESFVAVLPFEDTHKLHAKYAW
jgi:hypothetical protein